MVNKGSHSADFVRFRRHTHTRTQQSVDPYGRQLHVPKRFMIYQTIHIFPNICKPLSTKFSKNFLYHNENNNVSSVTFDVYFDLSYISGKFGHKKFFT